MEFQARRLCLHHSCVPTCLDHKCIVKCALCLVIGSLMFRFLLVHFTSAHLFIKAQLLEQLCYFCDHGHQTKSILNNSKHIQPNANRLSNTSWAKQRDASHKAPRTSPTHCALASNQAHSSCHCQHIACSHLSICIHQRPP